nr:unnamed protein product [Callosobruchus analis]
MAALSGGSRLIVSRVAFVGSGGEKLCHQWRRGHSPQVLFPFRRKSTGALKFEFGLLANGQGTAQKYTQEALDYSIFSQYLITLLVILNMSSGTGAACIAIVCAVWTKDWLKKRHQYSYENLRFSEPDDFSEFFTIGRYII